jgi:hypothetical protein
MWDTVLPTFEWLKNNVPEVISYTVKPAHMLTSIKQAPVLKVQIFLVLS